MATNEWTQDQTRLNTASKPVAHRQPFPQVPASAAAFSDRSHRVNSTTNISDRSGSANEVEHMLMHSKQTSRTYPINTNSGWHVASNSNGTGMYHVNNGHHHQPSSNHKGRRFRSAIRTFVVDYALHAVHAATAGFGAGPSTRTTRPSNTKFRPAIPK
ncbi:hypothetical protein CVT24_002049 [Panaeolus cyanescens]|uniref:Uncharacterized protein n=1 Tax=Panaeolus cyanescens TaxID=181874 RepID=A0A409YHL6_9AGAR|nr:hypothetical protein CVT24_002049 [Panaeolus cyanescens]